MLSPSEQRLAKITEDFEGRFDLVEVYRDGDPNPSAHAGTNRYVTICSGGPRNEGEPTRLYEQEAEAVEAYRATLDSEHARHGAPRKLYWRKRPQLERADGGWVVYSRLTFG